MSVQIGQVASVKRAFSQDDFDRTLVHLPGETPLGHPASGPGDQLFEAEARDRAPAYPGQELAASVEIARLRPEKQLVNLSTVCTNSAGEVVYHGEALVLVSDVKVQSHDG